MYICGLILILMRELQTNNVSRENMLIFDTHQIVKNFISAGFTEQQAEAVTNEQKRIIESNLANKKDIAEVKRDIKELDAKLTREIAEVKREIKEVDAKLTKEIAEVKRDIKEVDAKLTREIKQLDAKLTREIKEVDAKLTKEIAQLGIDFKKDIQIQQNKIIFRLGSVMVIGIGVLATLIKFF